MQLLNSKEKKNKIERVTRVMSIRGLAILLKGAPFKLCVYIHKGMEDQKSKRPRKVKK